MRVSIGILSAVLVLACGAVHAQAYRWVDKDGKVRYGDTPPPGIKATPMKAPASGSAPAPAPAPGAGGGGGASTDAAAKDSASKNAKKGPLTPAEQEQAYRERQMKSKQAQEKAEKDRALADARRLNCNSAQESLRSLQMGSRVTSINAQGETVHLEDAERAVRISRAQKTVAEECQ